LGLKGRAITERDFMKEPFMFNKKLKRMQTFKGEKLVKPKPMKVKLFVANNVPTISKRNV